MKTTSTVLSVLVVLAAVLFLPGKNAVHAPEAEAMDILGKKDARSIKLPSIQEFTTKLYEDCAGADKPSEGIRRIKIERITRIVSKNLEGLSQYVFVGNLCLETRVGKLVKPRSHAGAIGISQLMPATAMTEAKRCGFGDIKTEDLYDDELNLEIATCHFKKLVEEHGLPWAPLAYNAGGSADSVKRAKSLVPPGNLETAGYGAIQGIILTRYLLEPMMNQVVPTTKVKKSDSVKAEKVETVKVEKSAEAKTEKQPETTTPTAE